MEKKYSVVPVTVYRVSMKGKKRYYTKYKDLGDGYAAVMKKGKWGILTPEGNIWGRMEYSYIYAGFSENMLRVEKNGKYGYADKEAGRFIDCIFDHADDFHDGKAKVKYQGEYRVINTVGKFID